MTTHKQVTIFCSAASSLEPEIFSQASEFCRGLGARKWGLVYGGGRDGLMGHMANETLKAGSPVIGVIPTFMKDIGEVAHEGLTTLELTKDMSERKIRLNELGDAYVVFPGGLGTLDEALEVMTLKTLGLIQKPTLFVSVNGFWDSFLASLQELHQKGSISTAGIKTFHCVKTAAQALSWLDAELKVNS